MTDTPLKHKKCRGSLAINLTDRFSISSPGIGISPEGITIGVLEIKEKSPKKNSIVLHCLKCSKDMESSEIESVEYCCIFCREIVPAENVFFSHQMGGTCGNCLAVLRGEKKTDNPELMNLLSCFLLPKEGFEFVSLASILKNSK